MAYLTERGTDGLRLIDDAFQVVSEFKAEDAKGVRCFAWSPDGKLLAYCNNVHSIIVRVQDWAVLTRVSFYFILTCARICRPEGVTY